LKVKYTLLNKIVSFKCMFEKYDDLKMWKKKSNFGMIPVPFPEKVAWYLYLCPAISSTSWDRDFCEVPEPPVPDLDSPGRSSLLQPDLSPWLFHPLLNQPQTRRSLLFFVDFYFGYSTWVVCLICGLFWVCISPEPFVWLPRKWKETRRFKIVVSDVHVFRFFFFFFLSFFISCIQMFLQSLMLLLLFFWNIIVLSFVMVVAMDAIKYYAFAQMACVDLSDSQCHLVFILSFLFFLGSKNWYCRHD
jgi:hypothetical protein